MITTAKQVYQQHVKNIPIPEQLELIALISHQLASDNFEKSLAASNIDGVDTHVEATVPTAPIKRSAMDILQEASGHRIFKAAEDVETYLDEERKSWD